MRWRDNIATMTWCAWSIIGVYVIFIFLLSGCAGTQMTPVERQEQQAVNAENWENCKYVIKLLNDVQYNTHTHRRGRKHHNTEIVDDLWDNNCRARLGPYWISR